MNKAHEMRGIAGGCHQQIAYLLQLTRAGGEAYLVAGSERIVPGCLGPGFDSRFAWEGRRGMRHSLRVTLTVVVAILAVCGRAGAAFDKWALGFKTGTLGLGGELTTSLAPNVNLRGSIQWLDLDFDVEFDDIDYDVDVDFFNPLLLVDWYPFQGGFRVSGGLLFNGSDISLDATPSEAIEIGDRYYAPAEIGSLRGESDFDDIAPYVGIGFSNPLSRNGHWGFTADAGVAFIGSPNVDLRVTGPSAADPELLADLAKEEREIEDDLDKVRFYPVLSLTLYYRF